MESAAQLKLRLEVVRKDAELAKQHARRLDAAIVEAEERHQLAQELAAAQADLARWRTRVVHSASLLGVFSEASSGGGLDSRIFSIAEQDSIEIEEEARPVSDALALELLEGVLTRGVVVARTTLDAHSPPFWQFQNLPEVLPSAAALANGLRLAVSLKGCPSEDGAASEPLEMETRGAEQP